MLDATMAMGPITKFDGMLESLFPVDKTLPDPPDLVLTCHFCNRFLNSRPEPVGCSMYRA